MSEETVENILKNSGLTHSEMEVYIFLAKHGVLKCGEVARRMKKDRGQALRILKSLQTKNLVEATLEVPTRYASVPFEQLLDLSIKTKRDEAELMESTKRELLNYWKTMGRNVPEPSLEKFVVIEGDRKIYQRVTQMVKETKNQLSSIFTVADLVRTIEPDLSKVLINQPSKSKVRFRFLTEVSDQNVTAAKYLVQRTLKMKVELKIRTPDLGLGLFPRMMIVDNEEILLFIKPKVECAENQANLCLWTNCKTIVQSFGAIFEDLWINSTSISEKTAEIAAEKPILTANIISDISKALKTYDEALSSAKEEIMMMTSSEGLLDFRKHSGLLKELSGRGVSIRIMAPITRENWLAAQELSHYSSIRHAPRGYLESTIVDGKHLIQSKSQPFFGTFYTDDREYVEKTKATLNEVWKSALIPSASTLEQLMNSKPAMAPSSKREQLHPESDSPHRKMLFDVKANREVILEKDVLDKIITGKKYPGKNWPNDIIRFYGSNGLAAIHPPTNFDLPDMAIWAMHLNKQSSFGAADCLLVFLWMETPRGSAYVPVAFVSDNPGNIEFHKKLAVGAPSAQNVHLTRKDELQIRVHGNTLFVGWTTPVPLFPTSRVLPPSCMFFEGYGQLTTGVGEFSYPSGVRVTNEFNGLDAFVTYFHLASKYSGPGTDGRMNRDLITTMYPP